MKILYHHRTLGDGAEGIHIREIVNAFKKLGHKVLVVGPVNELREQRSTKSSKLEKIKKMMPGFIFEMAEIGYNIYGLIELYKVIKSFQPDFIYDRYITFNLSSILIGKYYDLPVLLEVNAPLALERSSQPDEKLIFKSIAHWIEKWACLNASMTLVVSTPLLQYLKSKGVPREKLVVLPNGVDKKKFCPHPKSKELLKEIGAHNEDIIIGFTGVLRPWHGLDLLIKSVGNLVKSKLSVFLLIIGDGPIRRQVEKWLVETGIHGHAKITGLLSHDKVPQFVNLFDIAVSPKATFYASPMKVIEYMGVAKTVVVPNLPNFLDIVDPGINGEVYADGDLSSLTKVLAALCIDREKRERIGKNARYKVENRLNWTWNVNKICDIVTSMNGGEVKPA